MLDALDFDVPIRLWEAASRTPQPAGGYLPETGVLAELQDAAKKHEFGRTVLLAMRHWARRRRRAPTCSRSATRSAP